MKISRQINNEHLNNEPLCVCWSLDSELLGLQSLNKMLPKLKEKLTSFKVQECYFQSTGMFFISDKCYSLFHCTKSRFNFYWELIILFVVVLLGVKSLNSSSTNSFFHLKYGIPVPPLTSGCFFFLF